MKLTPFEASAIAAALMILLFLLLHFGWGREALKKPKDKEIDPEHHLTQENTPTWKRKP